VKTDLRIYFLTYKKLLILLIVVGAAVALTLSVKALTAPPSPLPDSIKQEINFKFIYPRGFDFTNAGWKYDSNNEMLSFKVSKHGMNTVISEQKTALAYQDDTAAYNRFIGGLRPKLTFNSPLGTVAIVNFVTAAKFEIEGETAILNSQGTFLTAHPSQTFTDDDWRGLFSAMKVDR